ncbi:hypothetical protein B0H11DRAFT_2231531 [Mycena galericulata]|nr:hypothetical protein B0H11DRAFT_2231531 [Mycena galericulata]
MRVHNALVHVHVFPRPWNVKSESAAILSRADHTLPALYLPPPEFVFDSHPTAYLFTLPFPMCAFGIRPPPVYSQFSLVPPFYPTRLRMGASNSHSIRRSHVHQAFHPTCIQFDATFVAVPAMPAILPYPPNFEFAAAASPQSLSKFVFGFLPSCVSAHVTFSAAILLGMHGGVRVRGGVLPAHCNSRA